MTDREKTIKLLKEYKYWLDVAYTDKLIGKQRIREFLDTNPEFKAQMLKEHFNVA